MALRVENPYDHSLVAEIEGDDDARMMAKLARAHAAFQTWRRVPLADRMAQVKRALDRFRDQRDPIATEITRQMGKPIGESRVELDTMLDRAEVSIELAESALAAEPLPERPGFVRRIEHEPLGVVLCIAAWNYPLLVPINVVVPALLAGNAVLLKHSPLTPLTGRRFSHAFAGLEVAELLQDLVVDHAQIARLVVDPRIAHVAFTGSVAGGRAVYSTVASARIIDVGLELGGKDPAYVAADADLDSAASRVVEGACYNAGQSCCAIERVYVHEAVYDEFLDRARTVLSAYVLGDPVHENTTMGPLARAANLAVLADQVSDAKASGARLLLGGDGDGRFFRPTLLGDVPPRAAVMREESFGPIVPVARVAGDDEAIARMDETRYGLTASVWTRDRERAERIAGELEVGTVYQNRCDYLDPQQPWTGARDSGKGSTLSRHGFWHLTRRKSIHLRT
ncbi:MAG: aldehyde dehydrogenase family protein [Proteobacteria bacterium]|nr:aldehyde dehydrogenase family protein [Pseudomonadota bacterium]